MAIAELNPIDAVRVNGGLVHIRPLTDSDSAKLHELNAASSDRSLYLRFFTMSRSSADNFADTLVRRSSSTYRALVASFGDEIVGVASFEAIDERSADVALLVSDAHQHEGIGTLLLEHLASVARHHGIRRFRADVLGENFSMLRVFRDLGFRVTSTPDLEVIEVDLDLDPGPQLLEATDRRESSADIASMQPLLAPKSIAVIGAGARASSVGHQVLRNIIDGGFTGSLHVVNPRHDVVLGIAAVPAATDLPTAPDLAIIAVPASELLGVVRDCGERGVRGLLVLTAGFGETGTAGKDLQDEVATSARRYGMRMIGPNCLGVLNTDPAVQLNATFAPLPMGTGRLGLASQSGALGIAVLLAAERCGLGISQFVSIGNKADVSGNDLLLAWEDDPRTSVIALYLESLGNPRKFSRIARRVSRTKPIIAIKAGRSASGQRAGQSHTAAAASSEAVVEALFMEAGVLRVDTMAEMLDSARVLSDQPVPNGPRLAIIGNSGGPEILAADAAEAAGLSVVTLQASTTEQLRRAMPSAASVANPIDLGAGAQPEQIAAALAIVVAAEEVDMVLAVFTETLVADVEFVMAAVTGAAAQSDKPIVATQVGREARSLPVPDTARAVPVFSFPEPAAAALGRAWKYAVIRARPPKTKPSRSFDVEGARNVVAERLSDGVEWLAPEDVARLLTSFGAAMAPQRVVSTADAAVRAAIEIGYPVAVKVVGGPVHKSDTGGVRLNVGTDRELAEAFVAVTSAGTQRKALIQPMIGQGIEMIVGCVQDAQFGPVVMVGAGGVLADLVADRTFRLAPIDVGEAEQMIYGLRTSRLLDGYRGMPAVSRPALADLVSRLAALADDLPEVAEIDLNPVICKGDQLIVVDARVRLAPAPERPDPMLRQLRPIHY